VAHTLTSGLANLFQSKVIAPVIHLLRVGASPRKLAWSLAVGLVVGINPLLGSTTVACLAVAFVLRLNLVASQITNHLVYPLQLAMFFVFLDAGDSVFHTAKIPLDKDAMLSGMRHHPLSTTRLLWMWEWHALVVWAVCSVIAAPILAWMLTPALHRLLVKLHEEPA
jgi:uncharacterized protein (DUF2062 family)